MDDTIYIKMSHIFAHLICPFCYNIGINSRFKRDKIPNSYRKFGITISITLLHEKIAGIHNLR